LARATSCCGRRRSACRSRRSRTPRRTWRGCGQTWAAPNCWPHSRPFSPVPLSPGTRARCLC
jgi:hypothetical protein